MIGINNFFKSYTLLAIILSKNGIVAKPEDGLLNDGPSGYAVDDSPEPKTCVGDNCAIETKYCGTRDQTREEISTINDQFHGWQDAKAFGEEGSSNLHDGVHWNDEVITVPTYMHIIHDGENGTQYIFENDSSYIVDQIKVANNALKGGESFFPLFEGGPRAYPVYEQEDIDTNIRICLMEATATENKAWYDDYEKYKDEFKNQLHRGGMESLNVYYSKLETDLGAVVGEATFPTDIAPENVTLDGIIIYNVCFPYRPGFGCGEGDTLVHEMGHWLSLVHTFQDGCNGVGDYMDDATPSDSYDSISRHEGYLTEASYVCHIGMDECSSTGYKTPVHNYMSYRPDNCVTEFSPGQKERMQAAWELYRHKEDYSKIWAVADDGYSCCRMNGVSCGADAECCGKCDAGTNTCVA